MAPARVASECAVGGRVGCRCACGSARRLGRTRFSHLAGTSAGKSARRSSEKGARGSWASTGCAAAACGPAVPGGCLWLEGERRVCVRVACLMCGGTLGLLHFRSSGCFFDPSLKLVRVFAALHSAVLHMVGEISQMGRRAQWERKRLVLSWAVKCSTRRGAQMAMV